MAKKDTSILTIVGNNLRKRRMQQNLSQAKLAFEAGLTGEYINKVEGGNSNISIKKLQLIADCLGIKIKDLVS